MNGYDYTKNEHIIISKSNILDLITHTKKFVKKIESKLYNDGFNDDLTQ